MGSRLPKRVDQPFHRDGLVRDIVVGSSYAERLLQRRYPCAMRAKVGESQVATGQAAQVAKSAECPQSFFEVRYGLQPGGEGCAREQGVTQFVLVVGAPRVLDTLVGPACRLGGVVAEVGGGQGHHVPSVVHVERVAGQREGVHCGL